MEQEGRMSVVDIVAIVFGIAFIAFLGGTAAWIWMVVIKVWRDRE